MSPDTLFLIGSILGLLTLPRIFVAFAYRRFPRTALITLGICIAMVLIASLLKPGGYTWTSLPNMIIQIVADIIH